MGSYMAAGYCITCNLIGCLDCISSSTCSTCNTGNNFILNSGTCSCVAGYTYSSGTCSTCSSLMPGCMVCSDATTCLTCDLAADFIPSAGQCSCNTGFYLSGSTCTPCGILGCTDCSDGSTCTTCNAAQHFTMNTGAGVGTCGCTQGYYLLGGTTCASCSLVGCLDCSSSMTCLTCDTSQHFVLNPSNSQCGCASAFYSFGSSCLACPTGCTTCTSTACTVCDTANGYTLSSGSCLCSNGYLSGPVCISCTTVTPMCSTCTSTTCSFCQLPTVLNGGVCQCSIGTYDDGAGCPTCSSQFIGCSVCTLGSCSACDATQGFQATPSSNVCSCTSTRTLIGSICQLCSQTLPGCVACSNTGVCTSCDTANGFSLSGSECTCPPASFVNASTQCQTCSSSIPGCVQCSLVSGSVECLDCDAANYYVLHDESCRCADNFTLSGGVCVSCRTSCSCYGYYLIGGVCLPFCSDGITISPEQCDDGNLLPGDGCSPLCTIEPGFSCQQDSDLRSTCTHNQTLSLNVVNIFKSPIANKLTFFMNLASNTSSKLPSNLTNINFSSSITTPPGLTNPTYVYNNGVLQLTYDFNETVQGKNISITLNPTAQFPYSGYLTVPVTPTNNMPAVVYDDNTYDSGKLLQGAYSGIVYSSYALLALGLATNSIIPIELFGLMQLAHLSTSNLEGVVPPLFPVMNTSFVQGFNVPLSGGSDGNLPIRVKSAGYGSDMIGNLNVMLGIILFEAVAAAVVFAIGKAVPSFAVKSEEVTSSMLKKYLFILVMFNTLNIAYCAGLQFKYAESANPNYWLSNVVAAVSLALPLAMACLMVFSDKKQFGQYSNTLQTNTSAQLYFVASILYRMLLGLTMSLYNEQEEGTIFNVFICILFTLLAISNTPFTQAYQNYRSSVVHLSELVVLSVAMYYRSMRSNTPLTDRSQILAPATLELTVIFVVTIASAACAIYEVALKIRQVISKCSQKKPDARPTREMIQVTMQDLLPNGGLNNSSNSGVFMSAL